MKDCTKCGNNKPFSDFYKKANSKTGYQAACKPCHKEAKRTWRANNPDKARKWDKNRIYSPEAREKRLKRSKERNQIYRDKLSDQYIISIIKASGVKKEDISKELIHLTRINIQLKRTLNLTGGKYNKNK